MNYSERVQGSTPNTWPNLAQIGPITVVDTHTCADTETYAKDSTDDKLWLRSLLIIIHWHWIIEQTNCEMCSENWF